MPTKQQDAKVAFAVTWEVREGEVEAAAEIIRPLHSGGSQGART
jgi:hypothetical protein